MAAGLLLDEIFSILLFLNLLRRFELRIFFTLQVVSLAWFQWVMTELKLTIFLYTYIFGKPTDVFEKIHREQMSMVFIFRLYPFSRHIYY